MIIRIQGVRGSSGSDRKTNTYRKNLNPGDVFLYKHTLKILKRQGGEGASVYIICIRPFTFT
jgi:hypothetical protein